MERNEFKRTIADFLKKMMGYWFEDLPLFKGLGMSMIDANINKYDNVIQMFEDEKGNIDVDNILKNIGLDEFRIDLKSISPMLPNRILLVSKEDIEELRQKMRGR